jgi:DNA-binding CsgD family transcriptional regulator
LPSPQAHALARALSLESGEGDLDAAALSAGVLNTVVSAAAATPVLIAVDDAQWLDPETERLLAFVLRRLTSERVGLLATVRIAVDEREPRELLGALPDEHAVRHVVGPLTVGALHEIIRTEIGSISRPTLLRLHEASGGNPLYALELARELAALDHELNAGEPLRVPSTLERLMESRLGAVPEETRETLLAVALLAQPSLHVLAKAFGDRVRVDRDVDVSEAAGLVVVERDGIRFAHPLFASVLVASATAQARRRVHRRLADAAESGEERVLHLALATDPPNAAVAAELDGAAIAARARAAPAAAAELAEQALVLTPQTDSRALFDRRLAAARFHQEAGSSAQAGALAAAAVAGAETSSDRAASLLQLALVTGSVPDRLALLRQAAAETGVDRGLRGEILAVLGTELDVATVDAPFLSEAVALAEEVLSEAVALAEEDTNTERRVRVLCLVAWGRTWDSGRVDTDLLERALELAKGSPAAFAFAACTYGVLLGMSYEHERARELLLSVRALGPGVDDERLAEALGELGRVEWAAGNWELAAQLTEEAARLAGQLGSENVELEIVGLQALVATSRGDVDAARTFGRRTIRLEALTGNLGAHIHGLALLELSLENYEAAYELVLPALERMAKRGARFPTMKTPIAIEALAHLGRTAEASDRLERFEKEARSADRAWALASVQHCRGLLAAADDDLQEAEALLADAAERSRELGLPFEHGRSLLALGTVRRRLQRKLAARETLEEARLVLDRLGARIWTARAEAELRRIGGRRNPAGSALSEMESQIAALVSSGHTNSEVAVALQISRKTVEWNLSKIYRKLGVRSRTELATRATE